VPRWRSGHEDTFDGFEGGGDGWTVAGSGYGNLGTIDADHYDCSVWQFYTCGGTDNTGRRAGGSECGAGDCDGGEDGFRSGTDIAGYRDGNSNRHGCGQCSCCDTGAGNNVGGRRYAGQHNSGLDIGLDARQASCSGDYAGGWRCCADGGGESGKGG
jgi:hypothetical protein